MTIMYGKQAKITVYIKPVVLDKLNEERAKTGESESGIVASILEAIFIPENNMGA